MDPQSFSEFLSELLGFSHDIKCQEGTLMATDTLPMTIGQSEVIASISGAFYTV